jgi:hypothetical protein
MKPFYAYNYSKDQKYLINPDEDPLYDHFHGQTLALAIVPYLIENAKWSKDDLIVILPSFGSEYGPCKPTRSIYVVNKSKINPIYIEYNENHYSMIEDIDFIVYDLMNKEHYEVTISFSQSDDIQVKRVKLIRT